MTVPRPNGVRMGGCADDGRYSGKSSMPVTVLSSTESSGARCMDGSPPGYYLREGDPQRWVVYYKGGGHCYDRKTCLNAMHSAYGSSSLFPERFGLDGLLSSEVADNPYFARWTHVILWYCGASLWLGSREEGVRMPGANSSEETVYFQGRRIALTLIDHLIRRRGLHAASEVLLAGDCAAGVGLLGLGDLVTERLPWVRKVRLVTASGYFLRGRNHHPDVPGVDAFHSDLAYPMAQYLPAYAEGPWRNVSSWVRAAALPLRRWEASSKSEYMYPMLQMPSFLINSAVDSCELDQFWGGLNGTMQARPGGCLDRANQRMDKCTQHERRLMRDHRRIILEAVRASGKLRPGRDGGFIHTCLGHADELRKTNAFRGVAIGGTSIEQALVRWWLDESGAGGNPSGDHWHLPCELRDQQTLQCNPSCASMARISAAVTLAQHADGVAVGSDVIALLLGAAGFTAAFLTMSWRQRSRHRHSILT